LQKPFNNFQKDYIIIKLKHNFSFPKIKDVSNKTKNFWQRVIFASKKQRKKNNIVFCHKIALV
jgi:hypothetical protein